MPSTALTRFAAVPTHPLHPVSQSGPPASLHPPSSPPPPRPECALFLRQVQPSWPRASAVARLWPLRSVPRPPSTVTPCVPRLARLWPGLPPGDQEEKSLQESANQRRARFQAARVALMLQLSTPAAHRRALSRAGKPDSRKRRKGRPTWLEAQWTLDAGLWSTEGQMTRGDHFQQTKYTSRRVGHDMSGRCANQIDGLELKLTLSRGTAAAVISAAPPPATKLQPRASALSQAL